MPKRKKDQKEARQKKTKVVENNSNVISPHLEGINPTMTPDEALLRISQRIRSGFETCFVAGADPLQADRDQAMTFYSDMKETIRQENHCSIPPAFLDHPDKTAFLASLYTITKSIYDKYVSFDAEGRIRAKTLALIQKPK